MSTAAIWPKSKPEVREFQYGGVGEFNGMSSQSHLPHCRVLPPGEFNVMIPQLRVTMQGAATGREFTVMIPEPDATLQGAVTWRNHCHDRATLLGEEFHPPYWKSFVAIFYFFCFIFFVFLMQFRLWLAAAFVSSPIHLLIRQRRLFGFPTTATATFLSWNHFRFTFC